MKRLLYIIIPVLGIMSSACEKENKDGFYVQGDRIYFPDDSLKYSFGPEVLSVSSHVFEYPVQVMGMPEGRERKFRVATAVRTDLPKYDPDFDYDPAKIYYVAAEPGVQFIAPDGEYTILPDSINGFVPIQLLRGNLPVEDLNVQFCFDLILEPSGNFGLGAAESIDCKMIFNNCLEKPEWWDNIYGSQLLNYFPLMYRRIIEYYGHPLDTEYVMGSDNKYLELMMVLKTQVYDYGMEHPELGWEFAEGIWWPWE